MDVAAVARHWAETWQSAWPAKQAADIAALYDHTASYRSSPFGEPEPGGALAYSSHHTGGHDGAAFRLCRSGRRSCRLLDAEADALTVTS
jgi:hypothetical protein